MRCNPPGARSTVPPGVVKRRDSPAKLNQERSHRSAVSGTVLVVIIGCAGCACTAPAVLPMMTMLLMLVMRPCGLRRSLLR